MKKNILTYLIIFLILLIIFSISQISWDDCWEYGFSYNIARGLLPYKDFNMVVGPLYSLLFSVPMIFFGNYFILYKIEHCLIYAFIFTYMYKQIGKNTIFMMLLIGLFPTTCGYNLFCVMLFLLILMLLKSDYKYSNILIGLLIGSILMTKHNIGLVLLIIYLCTSKERIKSLISVSIPCILVLLYLLFTKTFYLYIDYCYLGLGSFLNNQFIEPYSLILLIVFIIILVIELKKYLRSDKKDKRIIYVIGFFIIVLLPILDKGHLIPAATPVIFYILTTYELKKQLIFKYSIVISYIVFALLHIFLYDFNTKDNFLKYNVSTHKLNSYLSNCTKYVNDNYGDNKIYYITEDASIIKLYQNETTTKYDLLNDGNMGTHEDDLIKEMNNYCDNHKCIFILDYHYFTSVNYFQYSEKFKNNILKNYKYIETIPSKDRVYGNYKKD